MNLQILALNLQNLISNSKLGIAEIAKKLEMTETTINKLKSGKNINPTIKTLNSLAKFFNITTGQLIGEQAISNNHLDKKFNNPDKITKITTLPLINWKEVISWPSTINKIHDICYHEFLLSSNSYAVTINTNDYDSIFKKNGVIIVDPSRPYQHGDYVVVSKTTKTNPSIKELIEVDGEFYFKCLTSNVNIVTRMSSEYDVLGVIVSYKIIYSQLNTIQLSASIKKLVISKNLLPLASIKDKISDVINIINEKKLGFVIIVDGKNYPIGILTDGDIRKNLIYLSNMNLQVSKIMTKNPKTININESSIFALKYFQLHKITSAIVIDDDDSFLGAIHIHDLLDQLQDDGNLT